MDTVNRLKWKTVICCGDPWKGKSCKKRKYSDPGGLETPLTGPHTRAASLAAATGIYLTRHLAVLIPDVSMAEVQVDWCRDVKQPGNCG